MNSANGTIELIAVLPFYISLTFKMDLYEICIVTRLLRADDGIHFTNQILQRIMDTLYTAHQHWLSSTAQCEDLCDTPYVLVPALQSSDDKHIATCATRIYDQQMVQELTYGEDAQPSTQEILSSMQQFVLALKKGIAQDRMAALSKEAAELLAAEVVDEKRYREVMEEMRGIEI